MNAAGGMHPQELVCGFIRRRSHAGLYNIILHNIPTYHRHSRRRHYKCWQEGLPVKLQLLQNTTTTNTATYYCYYYNNNNNKFIIIAIFDMHRRKRNRDAYTRPDVTTDTENLLQQNRKPDCGGRVYDVRVRKI